MMKFLGEFKFKLFLCILKQKDAWNEIKLSGIKHYFSKIIRILKPIILLFQKVGNIWWV